MQPPVDPDATLEACYRRTHYEVLQPDGTLLLLRVDVANAALQLVHERCRVSCSAFLTAWNPRSLQQSEQQNAAANRELQQRLAAAGVEYWAGRGRDPDGAWSEESLFVPGLELAAASLHGRHFGQNAILHAGADAVPRLVWLQPARSASPQPASPR